MKPIKKLEPVNFKQEDRFSNDSLQASLKTLAKAINDLSTHVNLNKASIDKLIQQLPKSNPVLPVSHLDHPQNEERTEKIAEQRFQVVSIPLVKIRECSGSNEEREVQIQKWIGSVCKKVFAVGFSMYRKQEIKLKEVKVFCSQNLLRNIVRFSKHNNLRQNDMKIINKCLKNELLPYFKLKYPQTEQSQVNMAFAKELKQVDNLQNNAYDLIEKSGVKFAKTQDGHYDSDIMKFVNFLIDFTNSNIQQKNQGQHKTPLNKQFETDMQQYFQLIFESPNSTHGPTSQDKLEEQKEKAQKVKSYTSYQIGQKLSNNFVKYSQEQINESNFTIKNNALIRVVTKWCQQLASKFEPNYIENKQTQMRMKDGSEAHLEFEESQLLQNLLNLQKMFVVQRMTEIQQNNHLQQSYFSLLEVDEKLKIFSEEEAQIGQFSALLYKNYENYCKEYLNLLIHSLNKVEKAYINLMIIKKSSLKYYEHILNLEKCSTLEGYYSICSQVENQIHNNSSNNNSNSKQIQKQTPKLISFKIGDLLRCKCTSKQAEIIKLYKHLQSESQSPGSHLKIIRVKNRLSNGNRDILINVLYRNTIVTEVQLAIKSQKSKFIQCSNQFNHFFYQLIRAQFGPLAEMASIWISYDQRSSYFLKKTNSLFSKRNKHLSNENTAKRCSHHNTKTIRLPFECSQCSKHYSDVTENQNHKYCPECTANQCFHCQVQNNQNQPIHKIIPQMEAFGKQIVENLTLAKAMPKNGGIILNLESRKRKPKLFTVIQNDKATYFFEEIANEKEQQKKRLRLVKSFNKTKQIKQFAEYSQNNLIFVSDNIGEILPKISQKQTRKQYFIPDYLSKMKSKQKNSIRMLQKELQNSDIEKQGVFWSVNELNLSKNNLSDLDVISQSFPAAKSIIMKQNSLSKVSTITFERWQNAQDLDLSVNQISKLPPNILKLQKLKALHLWTNCIAQLPNEVPDMHSLTLLNLQSNQIAVIPQNFFKFPCLQILNLSNNRIEQLPQKQADMPCLKQFHLSFNKIKVISSNLMRLQALQVLQLQQNRIQGLAVGGANIDRLKVLNLKSNKLEQVPECLLKHESLRRINLQKNNMKQIACQVDLPNIQVFKINFQALNLQSQRPLSSKLPHINFNP